MHLIQTTPHFHFMANYSHSHICQCLSGLLNFRRHFSVIIAEKRHKTGQELAEEVLSLAQGLLHLGLTPGQVVAISAYNRYLLFCLRIFFYKC